jgi:hypothetical protein
MRLAFLETVFLFREFGETESKIWLPRMFEVARDASAVPVPVATLDDMIGPRGEAFQLALANSIRPRIAIRVESGEVNSDLSGRVAVAMSKFGATPEDCALILDFADADFSNIEAVALVVQAAIEDVQAIGLWQSLIFQGTNYPEKNPADENSSVRVLRNEWLAWRQAVQIDLQTSKRPLFGDYCADSAKFEFASGGGAAPIRHLRYCNPESWLVARGESNVPQTTAMKAVCQTIVNSGQFAGADFSSADEHIYGTAKGYMGPGNPSTWREINTTHHITQVVSDIGKMTGFTLAQHPVAEPSKQTSLFDAEV